MSEPVRKDGALLRRWTLWYLIPDRYTMKDADWKDFLHKVCDFDTVYGFWAALNSLEKAAYLPKGCRFYVFKQGIVPLWEDVANDGGYELSLEHVIAKTKKQKINDRWEDILMAVIGGTFNNNELINGLEFTVRTETFRICLWLSKCDEKQREAVVADLKKVIKWNTDVKVTSFANK